MSCQTAAFSPLTPSPCTAADADLRMAAPLRLFQACLAFSLAVAAAVHGASTPGVKPLRRRAARGAGAANLSRAARAALVPNLARYQKPYNICTSAWEPFVSARLPPQPRGDATAEWQLSQMPTSTTAAPLLVPPRPAAQVSCTAGEDASTYDGYQIELWRRIAADLGWKEGADWAFTCIDWTPMLEDLVSPGGSCTVGAAGAHGPRAAGACTCNAGLDGRCSACSARHLGAQQQARRLTALTGPCHVHALVQALRSRWRIWGWVRMRGSMESCSGAGAHACLHARWPARWAATRSFAKVPIGCLQLLPSRHSTAHTRADVLLAHLQVWHAGAPRRWPCAQPLAVRPLAPLGLRMDPARAQPQPTRLSP